MSEFASFEVVTPECEVDGSVDVWADSVGEAVGQLCSIAVLGIAVKILSGLFVGVAQAMH
jgi:hypothetical protein